MDCYCMGAVPNRSPVNFLAGLAKGKPYRTLLTTLREPSPVLSFAPRFDDMMALLARKDPHFSQVVAVDAGFVPCFDRTLLLRVCAADLGEGLIQDLFGGLIISCCFLGCCVRVPRRVPLRVHRSFRFGKDTLQFLFGFRVQGWGFRNRCRSGVPLWGWCPCYVGVFNKCRLWLPTEGVCR